MNSDTNQTVTACEAEVETGAAADTGKGFIALAVEKIAKELTEFKGGSKETAVSKFVASALTHFCEENERFAEILYKTPRTLSECCAEVMAGTGNAVSDIDVYRGAVQSYFPNSDVAFKMEITITGDAPNEEEISRPAKKKVTEPKQRKESKTEDTSKSGDSPKKETPPDSGTIVRPSRKRTRAAAANSTTEVLQLSLL